MEIISILKLFLSIVIKIINPAIIFFKKIRNLWCRPKLKIDIKSQDVIFSMNQDKKYFLYFCFIIENCSKEDLRINPNNIYINNHNYQGQKPIPEFDECESKICIEYMMKRVEISHGNERFILKSYHPEIFPIKPVSSAVHIVTSMKKNSLLFFSKRKISITFEINNKIYEYEKNRNITYEKLINYLAAYDGRRF